MLLWLSRKSYSISDYNGKNHMGFLKKKAEPLGCHQPIADTGDSAPGMKIG